MEPRRGAPGARAAGSRPTRSTDGRASCEGSRNRRETCSACAAPSGRSHTRSVGSSSRGRRILPMIGFFDAASCGGIGMFDHLIFGGPAHGQLALLFVAAAARAPHRHAARMPARLAGLTAAILLAATIVMGGYI